jgi:hypothetical protein
VCTVLRLVHLHLDPMIVDPLRSDPMDGICSSPLRFLCSLDVDLTVQDPSTTNQMVVVAPPPELLISSNLEYFVSLQRFSAFELSLANPTILGLAYALESIISSEILDLE